MQMQMIVGHEIHQFHYHIAHGHRVKAARTARDANGTPTGHQRDTNTSTIQDPVFVREGLEALEARQSPAGDARILPARTQLFTQFAVRSSLLASISLSFYHPLFHLHLLFPSLIFVKF